jgi:uncharacterized protein (TIGR02996 family)
MTRDHAAFLEAIYAAPEDDEPRRVYADWLLQDNDPRGEYIHLQLLATKNPKQRRRERALFVVHVDRWIDELGADPAGVVFERGFVAIARPRGRLMCAVPGWGTVHTLLDAIPHDEVAMPALRVLDRLTDPQLELLARRREPLLARELRWLRRGPRASPFPPYVTLTVLPMLKRLELARGIVEHQEPPKQAAWLWSAPWTRALEELVLNASLDQLEAWRMVVAPTQLHRIELRDSHDEDAGAWRCALARDHAGALTRLEAQCALDNSPGYRGLERLESGVMAMPPRTLTAAQVAIPRHAMRAWRPSIDRMFANQIAPRISPS